MFVDVAVMAGVDITALCLDRAAAAAADRILIAATLGATGRTEAARAAIADGLALRVHGLVWSCKRARAPAAVWVDVLVRRAGNARARIVVARIPAAASPAAQAPIVQRERPTIRVAVLRRLRGSPRVSPATAKREARNDGPCCFKEYSTEWARDLSRRRLRTDDPKL